MAVGGSRFVLRWSVASHLLKVHRCNSVHQLLRASSNQAFTNHQKWQLFGAICIERKPVITRPLTPLETKYAAFIEKLELQQSLKSDHELRHEGDIVRAEQLKAGTIDEADIDAAIAQTAQDFEDASYEELGQFKPAARVTDADLKNDRRSLDRALDRYLTLVINQKLGQSSSWIYPQCQHENGETLRQTAERVLRELCGSSLKVQFLGNAPIGFYKYKFPKQMRGEGKPVGAKVFFYKAHYMDGVIEPKSGVVLDYQWMTYSNMQEMLKPNYLDAVSQFIVSDEVSNSISLKTNTQSNPERIIEKQAALC